MKDDFGECYEILEIEPGSSRDEIKEAYLDLVKVWHPDRYLKESARLQKKAEEKLKAINTAYERLRTGRSGAAIRPPAQPRNSPAPAPPARPIHDTRNLRPVQFGKLWGYVDQNSKIVLKPEFVQADHFFEGLARVAIESAVGRLKIGYVNGNGEYVITPQFLEARRFSDGLAAAVISIKWGFIGTNGEFLIHPEFEEVSDFHEKTAAIRQRGRWGWIDHEGRYILTPRYEATEPFQGGWARVKIADRWGKINREGQLYLDGEVRLM